MVNNKMIVMLVCVIILVAVIPIGAAAASTGQPMVFKDVKDTDWFKPYVDIMSSKGICEGYGNGLYGSNDNLQVDQLLKLVVVSMGYDPEACDTDYWACRYIKKAEELGLIKEGEFTDYTSKVTRGEIARIIARGIQEPFPSNLDGYKGLIKDYSSISTDYQQYVLKVYCKGIVGGYPDGTFKANNYATRAEASKMIVCFIDPSKRSLPALTDTADLPNEFSKITATIENSIIKDDMVIYSGDGKADYGHLDWFLSTADCYVLSIRNYNGSTLSSIKEALKAYYPESYETVFTIVQETIKTGKTAKGAYYDDLYFACKKFDNSTSVYIGFKGVNY